MKRILISIRDLNIGGVQKSLVELLKAFNQEIDSEKIQIDLLCLNSNGILKNEINPKVKIIVPNKKFRIFGLSNAETKKKQFTFIKRSFWALWSKMFSNKLPLRLALKNQSNLGDYDIAISYATTIDGHSMYAGWSELILEKCNAKKKIVYIHNDYINSALNNTNTYKLLKQFDKIWFVSKSCEKSFLESFKEFEGKTDYIYNFIDIDRVKKLANEECDFKKNTECLNFVSVSRLSPEKGHVRTLNALKKLKDDGFNFVWHIIGDGPEKQAIELKINELNLQTNIIMYGAKANPYPYMKHANFLMLNSLNESFGIVLIENMLLGKTVFSTNTIAADEIIKDNGIVCENSEQGIYKELKKIMEKPAIIKEFEKKLKSYSYDNKEIKNKLERLINE